MHCRLNLQLQLDIVNISGAHTRLIILINKVDYPLIFKVKHLNIYPNKVHYLSCYYILDFIY